MLGRIQHPGHVGSEKAFKRHTVQNPRSRTQKIASAPLYARKALNLSNVQVPIVVLRMASYSSCIYSR